ncbi:MAG: hypothetical protein NVSMB26_20750 [Beijerinckiaceae bacterium]
MRVLCVERDEFVDIDARKRLGPVSLYESGFRLRVGEGRRGSGKTDAECRKEEHDRAHWTKLHGKETPLAA